MLLTLTFTLKVKHCIRHGFKQVIIMLCVLTILHTCFLQYLIESDLPKAAQLLNNLTEQV